MHKLYVYFKPILNLRALSLIFVGFAIGWFLVLSTALLIKITHADIYLLVGIPFTLLALAIILYATSRFKEPEQVRRAKHAK